MKYLKIEIAREQHSVLYIEVPDEVNKSKLCSNESKIDLDGLVTEQLLGDSSCWETDPVCIENIQDVDFEEANCYGWNKLEDFVDSIDPLTVPDDIPGQMKLFED